MENKTKKVILITGASSGIGKALSKLLIKNGETVIGIARSSDGLTKLSTEISSSLFNYYVCDVSDTKAIDSLVKDLINKNIIPDVVICAASISENDYNPFYNHLKLREIMEINFFGTMNIVNALYPHFIKRKSGHFISLSSVSAFKPSNKSISYGASKAAIAIAFRGLQLDSRNKNNNVDFSTIYLGPVNTQMWEGKKSFVIIEPDCIARKIQRVISHPRTAVFLPFLSTTLFRISLLIPDFLYVRLSKYLFK